MKILYNKPKESAKCCTKCTTFCCFACKHSYTDALAQDLKHLKLNCTFYVIRFLCKTIFYLLLLIVFAVYIFEPCYSRTGTLKLQTYDSPKLHKLSFNMTESLLPVTHLTYLSKSDITKHMKCFIEKDSYSCIAFC